MCVLGKGWGVDWVVVDHILNTAYLINSKCGTLFPQSFVLICHCIIILLLLLLSATS